jgi:hypothetical protein
MRCEEINERLITSFKRYIKNNKKYRNKVSNGFYEKSL